MDSEIKDFLDYLHEVSHQVLKVPRKFVNLVEDIDSDSEMADVDRKFSEWINNNNFFNNSNNMGRKKKLYLVWQSSGSYDTYYNRLCGVFDSMEAASKLKEKLDQNVVKPEECWTIMSEDVYCNWPTVENVVVNECDFEYVSEYEGYTREQRDEQEVRWFAMIDDCSYAVIEEVYMNEEL